MYCEPYFKGVITFSRAKITLGEVTQRKASSLMYQRLETLRIFPRGPSAVWRFVMFCQEKLFIDGETPGRSRISLPAGVFSFLSSPETPE